MHEKVEYFVKYPNEGSGVSDREIVSLHTREEAKSSSALSNYLALKRGRGDKEKAGTEMLLLENGVIHKKIEVQR